MEERDKGKRGEREGEGREGGGGGEGEGGVFCLPLSPFPLLSAQPVMILGGYKSGLHPTLGLHGGYLSVCYSY